MFASEIPSGFHAYRARTYVGDIGQRGCGYRVGLECRVVVVQQVCYEGIQAPVFTLDATPKSDLIVFVVLFHFSIARIRVIFVSKSVTQVKYTLQTVGNRPHIIQRRSKSPFGYERYLVSFGRDQFAEGIKYILCDFCVCIAKINGPGQPVRRKPQELQFSTLRFCATGIFRETE